MIDTNSAVMQDVVSQYGANSTVTQNILFYQSVIAVVLNVG